MNTSAWNHVITGRKRWALHPPEKGIPKGMDEIRDANRKREPTNYQHFVGSDHAFRYYWAEGVQLFLGRSVIMGWSN